MSKTEARNLSLEEQSTIANIASLYYEGKLTQQEVCERTGIRQAQISRYLKLAEHYGIVVTKVDPYFTHDLANQLKDAFPHLKEVRVVPSMGIPSSYGDALLLEKLGDECAKHFCSVVPHAAKVGVSCGHSVESGVSAIGVLKGQKSPLPVACEVYPLIILMRPEMVRATPAALVADLVRWLPEARGEMFQLPSVLTGKHVESVGSYYRKNPQISQFLSKIKALHYYIIGIGAVDYLTPAVTRRSQVTYEFNYLMWTFNLTAELQRLGAVGESLYQPFEENGKSLISDPAFKHLRENILYLPHEVLRNHVQEDTATVVAVAGGESKHKAIHAAIYAKIFNTLITDSLTADYLLQKEKEKESKLKAIEHLSARRSPTRGQKS